MSRRKSENLKRYSTVGRLSINTTGSLDDDSNVFNANDPVFYNRMGQFKRSLDATHTESSHFDSESLVSAGTPPKNWHKNLDKFNKTLMHSPAKRNPHHLNTGQVAEQTGREMFASNKSPSEEESLNKTKNSELTDLDKSTTLNYSEELLKKRKPRTLQKLGNIESKSTDVFKKFFDDDSSSDAPKGKQASLEISNRRRLNERSKSKNSETTDSDKSVEFDYSEKLLKKRKPRTLQKFGNVVSKSTESVFKKFFDDDDDSLNDKPREKQDSMEISSRRRNTSNESANASQTKAIISVSRKRKLEGLETSHNSSLTKKRSSAGSEKSVNLSHSPTMSLKYIEKSETFTQPQKEKLRELLNESISKARLGKNESTASRKVLISPPIEGDKSTTEIVQDSNLQSKSISRHSQKSTHVQNKSAGKRSFVINEQSAVDNSESEIDVESRNEQTLKGDALQKIAQLDNLHVLNASQSEELVNNRHSISDSNIKLKSPRRSSRLNKSVEFERQFISSHLSNNFIEEPQFESTRKLDSNQSRPSPRKREAIRKSRSSGIQVVDEGSEIKPSAAVQSEKTVSLNNSKTLNRDVSDEKEASNYNIQVTTSNSSPKSSTSRKSDAVNNWPKSNSKTIGDDHSEKSLTISLSEEGSSRASVSSREGSVEEFPHNSSQRLSSSFKRSPQKSCSPASANKSIQDTEHRSQKPKIISSQIVNPNDIDLNKLRGNYKESQTEESVEGNLEGNLERSGRNFKTFSKRPRVSTIEEEFSLMHGVEDDQVPSTSDGRTGNSRNRTTLVSNNVSNTLKSTTQHNSSLKSLRKTLESEEDSEYSDNPLITYYQDDEINKEESPTSSPAADRSNKQNKENVPEPNKVEENKNIKDFVESRTRESLATSTKSVAKLNTDNSELMTVSEVMNDKKKWEEFYKRLSENKRQTQKRLDAAAAAAARLKVEAQKKTVKPIKEKKLPKPVHPAYLVNGKVYKQPKLPRPMPWATDRLYDYISKKIEPKYDIRTRIESGNIVNHLAAVVKKTLKAKLFKNYAEELGNLKKHMAEAGLIVTDKDFIDFCTEYLPISFRMKATPMLLPGNKMNMPYDWSKLYTPIEY
ncbi:uncharacterized protein LOC122505274 [Leptopilina heterotoma]|uniref:uncharacterized protein LOC122505274 n=1 Tax=Leptopilina heterotoma TaxID=63436 RepID=UPI001CA8D9C8|nr:uncharacterized protein LOC122505274 [Leptopilina heterotoma]